jgi:hypothetical protein
MQQMLHGLGCSLWDLANIAEYGYKYLHHTKWNMACACGKMWVQVTFVLHKTRKHTE